MNQRQRNTIITTGLVGTAFATLIVALVAAFLLGLAWLERVCFPLIGLTFKTREDSVMTWLLAGIIPAILIRHFVRPYPRWWPRLSVTALFVVTILAPLTTWLSLLRLWLRAGTVLGHYPRGMWDDPKHICRSDALYRRLFQDADYGAAFSGALMLLGIVLLLHLAISGHFTCRRFVWLCVVCTAAWLGFFLEPLQIFAWWLD
jgi:hypothetical protein